MTAVVASSPSGKAHPSTRYHIHVHSICIALLYLIFLVCIFLNLYVLLSREDTIFYLRVYHSVVGFLMLCCGMVQVEFLMRTRSLPKLEAPHEIPHPALIGAVALTIGIVLGYLYFIVFNYAYQHCDKLVDAIYGSSELWLESVYDVLMAAFSALSLVYIMQRRYYGAINTNLDKVGRLFINITFYVVWIKVVIYKGYLSHNELCQRKELEGYWCPVMKRHYDCIPGDDLHGTQKMWYYINKGILSSSIISCASEFFPVLLVTHWLACGGAEEKAEDILRKRQVKQGFRNLLHDFMKDLSRVYSTNDAHYMPPLRPSVYLKAFFWMIVPISMAAAGIKWLTFFYYAINFDHLALHHWMTSDYISLVANIIQVLFFLVLYLFARQIPDHRLDAHHKASARGDIIILFGCAFILTVKFVLQAIEQEYQRVDGYISQKDAIIKTVSLACVVSTQVLQYFAVRRILALSDRDIRALRSFLPLTAIGGLLIAWVHFGQTFLDTSLIKWQLTDDTFHFSDTTLICMIFTQTIFPADYLFAFTVSGCYLELLERYMEKGFFQFGKPRLVEGHEHGHGHGHEAPEEADEKPGFNIARMINAARIMQRKRLETESSSEVSPLSTRRNSLDEEHF